MKTKDEIIGGMCLTYRHDYGLLNKDEQASIWVTMKQIFDNDIAPYMIFTPELPPNSEPGFSKNFGVTLQAAMDTLQAVKETSEVTVDYGGVKVTLKK